MRWEWRGAYSSFEHGGAPFFEVLFASQKLMKSEHLPPRNPSSGLPLAKELRPGKTRLICPATIDRPSTLLLLALLSEIPCVTEQW